MDKYLELDQNQRVPFALSWHLLCCRKCRAQVRALTHAQKLAKMALKIPAPVNNSVITSVVKSIDPSYSFKEHHVPLWQWIIAGVLLLAILFYFTLFTSRANYGFLSFFLYTGMAFVFTAYCAVFVVSNIDFFVKKISTVKVPR